VKAALPVKHSQTEIGAGSMKNIIDYAIEESDTFENRKFNAADSLVLSQLAYLRFDKFVPGLFDTATPVSIKEIASKENLDMLFVIHGTVKTTGVYSLRWRTVQGFVT
jgi:hypothetical protein